MQMELSFANGHIPSHCNYCLQQLTGSPFHSKTTNNYFCDVFCAQDELDSLRIKAENLKRRMS